MRVPPASVRVSPSRTGRKVAPSVTSTVPRIRATTKPGTLPASTAASGAGPSGPDGTTREPPHAPRTAQRTSARATLGLGKLRPPAIRRQREREDGTSAESALDRDPPAVGLDDLV